MAALAYGAIFSLSEFAFRDKTPGWIEHGTLPAALLLWCILFVRSEPLLVRITLDLVGITLLGCIFTYRL